MKKKSLVIIIAIVAPCVFFSNSSMAERFNKDGYKIEILWKQKKDRLKVWGKVGGGKACKQLNLSLFFSNSKRYWQWTCGSCNKRL